MDGKSVCCVYIGLIGSVQGDVQASVSTPVTFVLINTAITFASIRSTQICNRTKQICFLNFNDWCLWLICTWTTFFLIYLDMAHVISTWQRTCYILIGRDSTVRRRPAWFPFYPHSTFLGHGSSTCFAHLSGARMVGQFFWHLGHYGIQQKPLQDDISCLKHDQI